MVEQMGFAEAFADPRLGSNRKLEGLAARIDWARLAPIARRVRAGATGRPPYIRRWRC